MRKWFLVLMLGMLFVFPSFASAQNQVAIETMDVVFWPEYDRADMLIINYITLASDVALPVTLDLRIPAASSIHTVAVGASPNLVSDQNVKYTTIQQDEWLVVSIEATGRAIQVEYYDPNLKKDGSARSYTYQWLSDYGVKDLIVVLQQPFDASAFKSSLSVVDDGIHADGLQYFTSSVGAVNAGKEFAFDISYNKPTDTFSFSQLQVEAVEPVSTDTPGRVSFNNYLPYIIGGLGILLALGGLAYYLQVNNKKSAKKSRRRSRSSSGSDEAGDTYCSQCGARARGGDRFCRTCGSRIKQNED